MSDLPATISALSAKETVVQVAPPRVNVVDVFESILSVVKLVAVRACTAVAPTDTVSPFEDESPTALRVPDATPLVIVTAFKEVLPTDTVSPLISNVDIF